ncbi:F-box domain containing protein [Trema orientale]|uniref:F-box domain containing protein n=1 Tax=Trema orientale TaxID=63057 RepID=A0A2P5F677_TREOI|nr:F-box domain containing protein [Trema orientale]
MRPKAKHRIHILGDDLLEEVLFRLPHRRYLSHYTSVCKRWHSLISSPHFMRRFIQFHHYHRHHEPSYSILSTLQLHIHKPLAEIVSKKSKILHGKPSPSSGSYILHNLPSNAKIMTSCKDLLLLSPSKN